MLCSFSVDVSRTPHQLLQTVNQSFLELAMVSTECKETSWMGSISYIGSTNTSQLPNRFNFNKNYFKARLDFIKAPIPPSAFNGAWKFLEQEIPLFWLLQEKEIIK